MYGFCKDIDGYRIDQLLDIKEDFKRTPIIKEYIEE